MNRTNSLALCLKSVQSHPWDSPRRDPIIGGIGDRINAAIEAEVERRLAERQGNAASDALIRAALDRSAEHDAACLRAIDELPELRAGLAFLREANNG